LLCNLIVSCLVDIQLFCNCDFGHSFVWGYSSVGRAPALQAGGHEFESHYLHQFWKMEARS
jgi:hypothetical protein